MNNYLFSSRWSRQIQIQNFGKVERYIHFVFCTPTFQPRENFLKWSSLYRWWQVVWPSPQTCSSTHHPWNHKNKLEENARLSTIVGQHDLDVDGHCRQQNTPATRDIPHTVIIKGYLYTRGKLNLNICTKGCSFQFQCSVSILKILTKHIPDKKPFLVLETGLYQKKRNIYITMNWFSNSAFHLKPEKLDGDICKMFVVLLLKSCHLLLLRTIASHSRRRWLSITLSQFSSVI